MVKNSHKSWTATQLIIQKQTLGFLQRSFWKAEGMLHVVQFLMEVSWQTCLLQKLWSLGLCGGGPEVNRAVNFEKLCHSSLPQAHAHTRTHTCTARHSFTLPSFCFTLATVSLMHFSTDQSLPSAQGVVRS